MKLVSYKAGSSAAPRGGILVSSSSGDGHVIDLARGFEHFAAKTGEHADYGHGVLGFVEHESKARPAADALVDWHSRVELPSSCILETANVTLSPWPSSLFPGERTRSPMGLVASWPPSRPGSA